MTRKWRAGALGALGFAIMPGASAQAAVSPSPSATAFAAIQGFQGQWTLTRDGKLRPYVMTYENASKRSIVTEQFGRELSVFYLDGNRLLMTHFCNAGNQPRLQLRADTKPGVLDFVMFDITGLTKPTDSHVKEIIYREVDPNRIELSIVWTGESAGAVEDYTLRRKP